MEEPLLWLLVATCASTLGGTLIGCAVNAVSGLMACSWDALFLTLSKYLNVEEHQLNKVNHGEAFARIVSEIGLETRRFQWQHEANPAADDKIEHGSTDIGALQRRLGF